MGVPYGRMAESRGCGINDIKCGNMGQGEACMRQRMSGTHEERKEHAGEGIYSRETLCGAEDSEQHLLEKSSSVNAGIVNGGK